MPSGVKIVLKGTAPNEDLLVAIEYRYSTKTSLFFITTEDAGNMMPGNPYIMKYTDDYGNLCTQEVEWPEALLDFFEMLNAIDHHNQSHQSDLGLEKQWVT